MNDLALHIQNTTLLDTHEHQHKESTYVENGPDVLQDLFGNYVASDLIVAGATPEAVERLVDSSDSDIEARWFGVRAAWQHCQYTGYGEIVRLIARHIYHMDEITPSAIEASSGRNRQLRQPGQRLHILKQEANLDHVQVDDLDWQCLPDLSGLDFFLYDLSWWKFCNGELDVENLHQETGIEVVDLATLREGMAALFAKYSPCAVAVKTQHAYNRTLLWQARDAADVARVLRKQLSGQEISEAERLCLGDWCWACGVELAIKHDLPFKIHTGYYAGHSEMPIERIRPDHLCELLIRYPQVRFVLMHIAYPYNDELVAIAKHFPNVYVDMCWAWSIDPYSASDFVRRMIHTLPINKLFAFGGDNHWPNATVAAAIQTRQWLTWALQTEVDNGLLTESQAIKIASRMMRTNQEECFNLDDTRAAIRNTVQSNNIITS